ncbi:MAG TPA: DUF6036 family nucleotidyltransferase, partial [Gemmataceae bacterium]|nr:DUF6036 family nucleotidyltransferase [Gemmataceae bacterium]
MSRSAAPPRDPWAMVWGQPVIDADRLAAAIEQDLRTTPDADFRTRLLIRDAVRALRSFWGKTRFGRWLADSPARLAIGAILAEDLGPTGFPAIRRRLVVNDAAVRVGQVFDLLGRNIPNRVEASIAGSIPTLIKGLTSRPTADINFVDEAPAEIRKQRALLRKIRDEYGLAIGHVQSHYLPTGWRDRRRLLGDYGGLRVYLVDEYDIFVSKLLSKKAKHQEDLRILAGVLNKETARRRLFTSGTAFLDDPLQRPQIEESRVERWRGGVGCGMSGCPGFPFVAQNRKPCSVSTSRSSNRTGGFPA